MPDDSAYRKILRLIGRGRDSPNNNNEEPEDEYGSVPEHLRGKTFEFLQSRSPYQREIHFLLFQFVAPGELERKDEYLIRNGRWIFIELVKFSHGKNNSFRIFSLKELEMATNNFSVELIVNDFFRRTYRGTIEDRHVAVRILSLRNMRTEVVSLSLIKHRNVVKLLGCCFETRSPILVHELPPNGILEENISKLSWTDRLRIATEIADALSYLHSELNITHGGLNYTDAVLLDEFHSAKLGAFDNSKIQNQDESSDAETYISDDVSEFGNILLNLLGIQRDGRGKFRIRKEKVEILKYLKVNVSEKEMPHTEAYIDLLLRCRDREDELSMEEVARELRHIRSMMNHQPTTDGNDSDNLSSCAN